MEVTYYAYVLIGGRQFRVAEGKTNAETQLKARDLLKGSAREKLLPGLRVASSIGSPAFVEMLKNRPMLDPLEGTAELTERQRATPEIEEAEKI